MSRIDATFLDAFLALSFTHDLYEIEDGSTGFVRCFKYWAERVGNAAGWDMLHIKRIEDHYEGPDE
jgi:hypothetical protein